MCLSSSPPQSYGSYGPLVYSQCRVSQFVRWYSLKVFPMLSLVSGASQTGTSPILGPGGHGEWKSQFQNVCASGKKK